MWIVLLGGWSRVRLVIEFFGWQLTELSYYNAVVIFAMFLFSCRAITSKVINKS